MYRHQQERHSAEEKLFFSKGNLSTAETASIGATPFQVSTEETASIGATLCKWCMNI